MIDKKATLQMNMKIWILTIIVIVVTISCLLCLIPLIAFSFIWMPVLLLSVPFLGLMYLILKTLKLEHIPQKGYYKVYDFLFYGSDKVRKVLWQTAYDAMVYLYPQQKWKCMNYGFSNLLHDKGESVTLKT